MALRRAFSSQAPKEMNMRKLFALTAVAALALSAAPVLANNGHGGSAGAVGGSFTSGSFEQGSHFDSTTTYTTGNGGAVGSSASGFDSALNSSHGGLAVFSSNGSAFSQTSVTPYSVTTASGHEGFTAGGTLGNAALGSTFQTFGQSNGWASFNTSQTKTEANANSHASFDIEKVSFVTLGGFSF